MVSLILPVFRARRWQQACEAVQYCGMSSVLANGSSFAELLIANYLPYILLLFWILSAGSVVVTALPVPVPQAFKDAVYLSACRGKLWNGKPTALGPLKDWSVPQVWFLHFYLLGACCNAAVFITYCLSSTLDSPTPDRVGSLLALLLFQLHLVRRAAETKFLLHYPPGAVMHGIAYLFGLSYYLVVPLSLLPLGWYQQRQWRDMVPWEAAYQRVTAHDVLGSVTPWQALGAAVFLFGNALQFTAHCQLAALSKGRPGNSERRVYKIPKGGLFEYVSCPHYLAEIIIYCGLCLVGGGRLLVLLILLWVVVNLVLAASATHQWYRSQFRTYPAARKALLPFVY